jgi:hypothetical protein
MKGRYIVDLKITYQNGALGTCHIQEQDIFTHRELLAVLARAGRIAASLKEEPAHEEAAPAWRPSVVGERRPA